MSHVTGRSGRPASEVTLDAVRSGDVASDDVRIHPRTLRAQADVAQAHENPQLAANLRRAAELSELTDEDVLRIYEALRPGRSTHGELIAIAEWLEARQAPTSAALVREAAAVYTRRSLLR